MKCRLGFLLTGLFLLLTICGGEAKNACPRIWAICPDREFQICRDCRLVKDIETDFYRFGNVKDCTTGWGRRVVVDKACSFQAR